MTIKRFPLSNFILIFAITLAIILNQNIALGNTNMKDGFSNLTFFILSGITLFLLCIYVFIEKKNNNIKFIKPSFIVALSLLIIFSVAIWNNPSFETFNYTSEYVVNISTHSKIVANIELAISIIIIYILFTFKRRHFFNPKQINWLIVTFVIGMIIISLCSFLVEGDIYKEYLELKFIRPIGYITMNNPNTLAFLYYLGILFLMLLDYQKPHWYSQVIMIYFGFMSIFTMCTTVLVLLAITLPLFFVYQATNGYISKKYLKTSLNIIITFAIALIAVLLTKHASSIKFFKIVKTVIIKGKTVVNADNPLLSNRYTIWKEVSAGMTANTSYLMFGRGYYISTLIIKGYSTSHNWGGFTSTHNGFLEVFFRYGLIGFSTYLFLLGYYVVSIFKVFFKYKKRRYAIINFICFMLIMAHSMPESDILFNVEIKDLIMTMVIVLPPIYLTRNVKEIELDKAIVTKETVIHKLNIQSVINVTSLILFICFLSSLALFIAPIKYSFNLSIPLLILISFCLLFASLLVPLIISSITFKNFYRIKESMKEVLLTISSRFYKSILSGLILVLIFNIFLRAAKNIYLFDFIVIYFVDIFLLGISLVIINNNKKNQFLYALNGYLIQNQIDMITKIDY